MKSKMSDNSHDKTEFSLNEISNLSAFELSNKIFTYDKRL